MGEDGGLIAGHARILAARQLGIAEIPVMVAAGWREYLPQRRDSVAPGARWRCRSVLEFIYKASIIIGQPVLLQN